MNDKIFTALIILSIALIIFYTRILPFLDSPVDQLSFWGPVGQFTCYVTNFMEKETIPKYDPQYRVYSSVYDDVPFVYPPLFITASTIFGKLLNMPVFLVCKTFVLFFGLAGIFSIYLFTKELTKNKKIGLLSALFLSVMPYYIVWTGICRYDVIVTLFPLGFYFLLRALNEKSYKLAALSGLTLSFIFLSHPLDVWGTHSTLGIFTLIMLAMGIKKKNYVEIKITLFTILIYVIVSSSFLLSRPVLQTWFGSTWVENSITSLDEYLRYVGWLPLSLTIIGVPIIFLKKIKSPEKIGYILLLCWLFAVWWGVETTRIAEKMILFPLYNLTGIQGFSKGLIRSLLASLASSRLYPLLLQPMSVISAIVSFEIANAGKRLKIPKFVVGVIIGIFILLAFLHSAEFSNPYLKPSVDEKTWESFRWADENLNKNSRFLTSVGIGLQMNTKNCMSQTGNYFFLMPDPWILHRLFTYTYTSEDQYHILWLLKTYNITHVYIDSAEAQFLEYMGNIKRPIEPFIMWVKGSDHIREEKFDELPCTSKNFDNGFSKIYEIDHNCEEFEKIDKLHENYPDCIKYIKLRCNYNFIRSNDTAEVSASMSYLDVKEEECVKLQKINVTVWEENENRTEIENTRIQLKNTSKLDLSPDARYLIFKCQEQDYLNATVEVEVYIS